jgi:hypothetical protein
MFRQDSLFFEIHVWVVHVRSADSWAEEDAENTLDSLELEVFNTVKSASANQSDWSSLQHGERSNANLEIAGGEVWLHEVIPVMAMVAHGKARREVREKLAEHLTAVCTSAQRVYAFQPKHFGTVTDTRIAEFPVVYVASAGAARAV